MPDRSWIQRFLEILETLPNTSNSPSLTRSCHPAAGFFFEKLDRRLSNHGDRHPNLDAYLHKTIRDERKKYEKEDRYPTKLDRLFVFESPRS
jgi:hypothetical protein